MGTGTFFRVPMIYKSAPFSAPTHLPLIVPCHRVVGTGDHLTGFTYGTEAKHHLLELESHGIL